MTDIDEAFNRMRRNASLGLSAGDYEVMNPDGYAIDMDTHYEDVHTIRTALQTLQRR